MPNLSDNRYYWQIRRLLFFFQQRMFAALSFILLDNMVSGKLRAALLRSLGATVGRACFIRGGLMLQEGFGLEIGDNVFINAGCCLDCSAPIKLGNGVQLAYQVTIITGGHEVGPATSRAGAFKPEPVEIGDGAWIGARSVILSGVKIGAGAVVAAGSVVTKDVTPNTLVAGVPAKQLKFLDLD